MPSVWSKNEVKKRDLWERFLSHVQVQSDGCWKRTANALPRKTYCKRGHLREAGRERKAMNYSNARDWEVLENARKGYQGARTEAARRGLVASQDPERPTDNPPYYLRPILQRRLLTCGHLVERLTAIQ